MKFSILILFSISSLICSFIAAWDHSIFGMVGFILLVLLSIILIILDDDEDEFLGGFDNQVNVIRSSRTEEKADLEKVLRENRAATVPYIGPERRSQRVAPNSEPDARCISTPDGGCISNDCMHTDPPRGKLEPDLEGRDY